MLLNEISSPAFAISKDGKVTVFLPELAGEPENPEISYLFENSLFFKRMADAGCPITGVPEDVVQQLRNAEKMLIIEINLDKVVDLNDGKISDPSDVFKRYYEATINKESFAEKAVDAI
ncbi:MAG: hypothetical protein IJ752_04950 [Alphaproteobacteria bacterium]|nr:hypothetical protein [Alphaproteobacteria bacterium]